MAARGVTVVLWLGCPLGVIVARSSDAIVGSGVVVIVEAEPDVAKGVVVIVGRCGIVPELLEVVLGSIVFVAACMVVVGVVGGDWGRRF